MIMLMQYKKRAQKQKITHDMLGLSRGYASIPSPAYCKAQKPSSDIGYVLRMKNLTIRLTK